LNVLLEGERELGAFLQLATEDDERSEDETSKERIEVRRAYGHVSRVRGLRRLSFVREQRS
jgi:hypothetical protein